MAAFRPTFKLNDKTMGEFRAAFRNLAAVTGKTDPDSLQKLALLSARRFVKNVASVTPPASGSLDSTAKKQGEETILSDLFRIALPVQAVGSTRAAKEVLTSAAELLAAHQRAKDGNTGRVNPRNRKEKLLVAQTDFNRVVKELQGRVGWLAAGLNAAAAKLGFSLPAWIKRHGEKFGKIEIHQSVDAIKIRITQNVPYEDKVKNSRRHWDFALTKEVNALVNQAKAIVKKRARQAGFKFKG